MMHIGHRLWELRTARRMSQRQLAAKCGWEDHGYISQIENCNVTNVGMENITRLAQGLGVRPAALIDDQAFAEALMEIKSEAYGPEVARRIFSIGHPRWRDERAAVAVAS